MFFVISCFDFLERHYGKCSRTSTASPRLNCLKAVYLSASTLLNDKHANLRSRLCSAWTNRGQERKLFNYLSRRLKRIIMAYRLCLRLCSRYIGLLLGRHEANTGFGFCSHMGAVISARFYSRAKLHYADF